MASATVVAVDCENVTGELKRIWSSIGYDEINLSYTERGKNLLKVLKDEVIQKPYYVRNHNVFTSGNCLSYPTEGSTNIYIEDEHGNPSYNFDIIDQIYDSFIENNFIPIIEFGFMPFDLATYKTVPDKDYELNGWRSPPKDLNKWKNLIQAFVTHLYQRYGKQTENWYFEVWNEPNIPTYWLGSFEDYCQLYDYSVEAIKSVNPNLKIGGPATNHTGQDFFNQFLQHITSGVNYANQKIGTQIDFISFHAKGGHYKPEESYGHTVPLEYPSITDLTNGVINYLSILYKYSQLNDMPILVDECDPVIGYNYGIYDNPNFGVCNTEYYPSMFASIIYNILLLSPRIQLITTWAFYMEGKRLFEGNRALVTNYNLYLPILNGFKLFEKLQIKKLSIEINNTSIPLNGICTFDENTFDIQLLLFSHFDDYTFNKNENVTIIFNNIKLNYVLVKHYKIDSNNNNIYSEWIKIGKPNYLNAQQLEYFQNFQQLKLFNTPILYQIQNNKLTLDPINISMHSIDFFEIINLDDPKQ